MELNKLMGTGTIISIILILGIMLAIFRGIKRFRDFITNKKEVNTKVEDVLNKLKDE